MFWLLYVAVISGLFYAWPVFMSGLCVVSFITMIYLCAKAPLIEDDRYA